MTLYSIFEKPQGKAANGRVRPARGPVAVPERFSWFAAILPPLYGLVHGLWLLPLFWAAVVMGLAYASRSFGTDAAVSLYALIAVFIGFEAPALRRDWLLFRGFEWRGDIIASGEDVAERDYLSLRK